MTYRIHAVLLGAAMLLIGCPASDGPPRPRAARPDAPPAARRAPASPLDFSDLISGVMTQLEKMREVFFKGLVPVILSAPNRPPLKDVLSSVADIQRAAKAHRASYARLKKPTRPGAQSLARTFEAYLDHADNQLRMMPALLKELYDPSRTRQQRQESFARVAGPPFLDWKRLRGELSKKLCGYLKSHGVRAGDGRLKLCPQGGRWLSEARDIEQVACACPNVKCAQQQQRRLNNYIRDTKSVKVDSAVANKVAKSVLKAMTCISNKLRAHRLNKMPNKRP